MRTKFQRRALAGAVDAVAGSIQARRPDWTWEQCRGEAKRRMLYAKIAATHSKLRPWEQNPEA